jgi:hypothetical protein
MQQYSVATIALATLLAASAVACDDSDEALAELQKMDQECQNGSHDKAREIMLAAAEKNETFREAYSFATSGLVDKAYLNPCGPVIRQIRSQLED